MAGIAERGGDRRFEFDLMRPDREQPLNDRLVTTLAELQPHLKLQAAAIHVDHDRPGPPTARAVALQARSRRRGQV